MSAPYDANCIESKKNSCEKWCFSCCIMCVANRMRKRYKHYLVCCYATAIQCEFIALNYISGLLGWMHQSIIQNAYIYSATLPISNGLLVLLLLLFVLFHSFCSLFLSFACQISHNTSEICFLFLIRIAKLPYLSACVVVFVFLMLCYMLAGLAVNCTLLYFTLVSSIFFIPCS